MTLSKLLIWTCLIYWLLFCPFCLGLGVMCCCWHPDTSWLFKLLDAPSGLAMTWKVAYRPDFTIPCSLASHWIFCSKGEGSGTNQCTVYVDPDQWFSWGQNVRPDPKTYPNKQDPTRKGPNDGQNVRPEANLILILIFLMKPPTFVSQGSVLCVVTGRESSFSGFFWVGLFQFLKNNIFCDNRMLNPRFWPAWGNVPSRGEWIDVCSPKWV